MSKSNFYSLFHRNQQYNQTQLTAHVFPYMIVFCLLSDSYTIARYSHHIFLLLVLPGNVFVPPQLCLFFGSGIGRNVSTVFYETCSSGTLWADISVVLFCCILFLFTSAIILLSSLSSVPSCRTYCCRSAVSHCFLIIEFALFRFVPWNTKTITMTEVIEVLQQEIFVQIQSKII